MERIRSEKSSSQKTEVSIDILADYLHRKSCFSHLQRLKKYAGFCLEILTRILLFHLYLISLRFCVSLLLSMATLDFPHFRRQNTTS